MAVFELIGPESLTEGTSSRVVIDSRSAADYWQGHIPGSCHVDPAIFTLVRTDRASIDRFHTLLAWALSALGISRDTLVVVAGAQNEVNASRVAWALAYAGVQKVALLDGGIKAWTGELTTKVPTILPSQFVVDPQTNYLATADEVLKATEQRSLVLDVRELDEFAGKRSNAKRTGRVPGARHWDTREELDGEGRFAVPTTAIRQVADANNSSKTIVYCGGGGRAARTFIALQLAGHTQAAVYPASWNEWGNIETYPVDDTAI